MKQFSKKLTKYTKIGTNKIIKRFESRETVPKIFGLNVFNNERLESRLPTEVYKRFLRYAENREEKLDPHTADLIATALKDWCESRGVSHFSHWFQPLTGATAEKHDSFIKHVRGHVINNFSGSRLCEGEADASSFPNGGLRPTHQARGYTVWDPSSPPFIMESAGVPTLFIPTIFFSWKGHALDTKLPLLRAQASMNKSAKKLFATAGLPEHNKFHSDSGVEQEFFLIDLEQYQKRPDLVLSGRSLQGAAPSKGQELCDSYFGPISERAWKAINEMEKVLWKLGVPITTRHREVAPNQYELAPIYEPTTIATDHNMITMEVMHRVAAKHGLAVLLHEKPFKGVSGSGKHNNWSLGSNESGSLFSPGEDPINNIPFLLTLSATIRGVDLHQDLLRFMISGASNDHRLGSHEAPPAIFSIYLGDDLDKVTDAIIKGNVDSLDLSGKVVEFNVPFLPQFQSSPTDRNRTSPFAFTGNKFEVRAVGSSQSPAFSNIFLNTLISESFDYMSTQIEKKVKSGQSTDKATREVIKEILTKHQRILFNGDGYSEEWKSEAKKRGLLNLKTTPDVLEVIQNEKNYELLEKTGVLNREEFDIYVDVGFDNYSKRVSLESEILANLANQNLLPAAVSYLNELNQAKLTDRANRVNKLVELGFQQTDTLTKASEELERLIEKDTKKASRFAVDNVIPLMVETRNTLDSLEKLVPKNYWPIPRYEEILFHQHL
eukprot:TRINITY_DN3583_c0_g1_i1.p1 TRINITY_DN3583_c0_g1~~TRINITY_DN3583_c0_g1_i1.p1  ORF type:complete len:721 (+),score=251.78 TRINITY_DN3583_c0_g1_i1:28-2190(+)